MEVRLPGSALSLTVKDMHRVSPGESCGGGLSVEFGFYDLRVGISYA